MGGRQIRLLSRAPMPKGTSSPQRVRNHAAKKSLVGEFTLRPYLKRTHVGEARSLRCSSELWRRNSAKCPRNFGRRGARVR